MESSLCLFCASECTPSFAIVDGQTTRLKSEHDHDDHHPSSFNFLEEETDPPLLGQQLKSVFILRNILGIKDDKLCEFLSKFEGALHPEFWFSVCSPCGEAVANYFKISKEISTLQKKLASISTQLKGQIHETTKETEDESTKSSIWADVRETFLKQGQELTTSSEPQCFTFQEGPKAHFKCFKCPATYRSLHNMQNHAKLHSPGMKTYPCGLCGWTLEAFTNSYKNHNRFHHSGRLEAQNSKEILTANIIPSQDEKVEMVLPTSDTEESWMVSLSGKYASYINGTKSTYKCLSGCSAKYDDLRKMTNHLRLHSPLPGGNQPEMCDICGELVAKKVVLSHLETRHPTSEITVQRQKAARVVKSVKSGAEVVLKEHEQYSVVSKGNASVCYKCKKCPVMFSKEEQITAHLELHKEGSGAVACEVCKFVLAPGKLQLHFQNHHG